MSSTHLHHGSLTIRPYEPGDEASILATFNLVFRHECGAHFVDRELAAWRWLYLHNPAGTQILLAVDADGTIASQYAAVPQTTDTVFGPVRFVHVVDSMTHPTYRQGLQREGLFAILGRAFTADYGEHGNEVGYGLPVRIAERIGARLLDYKLLRTVEYLVRPSELPLPISPAGIAVATVGSFPSEVSELWQQCLPARPCAVRRDHAYLQWRYVAIPTHRDYVRCCAYRGNVLCGVMVLRPAHELVPGACTIVDWICHDDDDDTAVAMLAMAARAAKAQQRRCLMAVLAPHCPAARHLLALGASSVPSAQWMERRLTYRITGPYVSDEVLATDWRYTLGDTDLC